MPNPTPTPVEAGSIPVYVIVHHFGTPEQWVHRAFASETASEAIRRFCEYERNAGEQSGETWWRLNSKGWSCQRGELLVNNSLAAIVAARVREAVEGASVPMLLPMDQKLIALQRKEIERLKAAMTERELAGFNRKFPNGVKDEYLRDVHDLCVRTVSRPDSVRFNQPAENEVRA